MPYWSIGEWRARIGSSWCALGRPFKARSPFRSRAGKMRRTLTLNHAVATMFLLLMSIGVNLGLRALVARGYHQPLLSFFKGSTLPEKMYLINLGLILTLVLQITSALVYQLLFMATCCRSSNSFGGDLIDCLSFRTCFVYYSIFLILKMINPSMFPIHWLILIVVHTVDCVRALTVLWETLTDKQVEKLHYGDTEVEVVIMTKREGVWVLAVAKAMLDIVLSVAASVILSLLLLSGDVEENPGPVGWIVALISVCGCVFSSDSGSAVHTSTDLDYNSVDKNHVLSKDDLSDIMDEVLSIKSMYFALGRSLRLNNDDLKAIRIKYESDADSALNDVLLLWLTKQYNDDRFGPPTWRMLVEAVDKKSGGNDHELAKEIALNHPAETVEKGSGGSHHDIELARKEITSKQTAVTYTGGAEVGNVSIVRKENQDTLLIPENTREVVDLLTPENTREVLDITWPHRARWRHIGIQLGIDGGTLDAIDANRRKVEDRLTDLIVHWLRNTKPKPTRSALTIALQSKCISSTSATTDNKQEDYAAYLKSIYKIKTQRSFLHDDQWPPPVTDHMKVCNLAMIKAKQVQRKQIQDEFVRMTITGKVDDILQEKIPIELRDIFKEIKGGEVRKVLLEGAPGCGKSTLSFHICQQWRDGNLFQEYRLVVLVKLRERAVHNANDIADLMPRRNKTQCHQVFQELTTSSRTHVLFILDGWDELPKGVAGRSIIIQILRNTSFDVIITSRPTSSMSLYELRVINTRIEILGFTKEELKRYFASCLENDDIKIQELQHNIQRSPVVAGTCYLPLNASILVHLFKFYDDKLPETQFDIFSALVRNCILRHLKKCKVYISGIKSLELDELPSVVKGPFTKICTIAYEGVMKDKIIFDNLNGDFNTLGLLQGVESLIDAGTSHSYNFLHLSIQELLAAIHMATQLESSQQVKQFKELFGRARFAAVFQFYAAKTKLKTPGIKDVVVEAVKRYLANPKITEFTSRDSAQTDSVSDNLKPKPLILSLLHCLYEAQDKALCELVVKQFKESNLSLQGISLNPADCLAVGYFLTYCSQFKVNLGYCSIGGDGCKTLFRKGAVYDLQSLDLQINAIGDEGAKALSEAMKTMTNLQTLDLQANAIGDEGAKALSEAVKTMTNLQGLYLLDNAIGDEGAKALSEAMKTMTNLQTLALQINSIGDEGAKALLEAMKTMTNLQTLALAGNAIDDEGAKALSEAMKTMTNLQELHLSYNAIGYVEREALEEAAKETGTVIFGV